MTTVKQGRPTAEDYAAARKALAAIDVVRAGQRRAQLLADAQAIERGEAFRDIAEEAGRG